MTGVFCEVFCHRDVIYDLRTEAVPHKEIFQYPGDTVFLPPGTLHMVTNVTANFSESINIIMKTDLEICRSYKICWEHSGSVQTYGSESKDY